MQVAMEDEVVNAGYRVPQFRINKDLINYYLDENGVYSESKYQNTPETTRVTYRKEIEKYIKDNRYIEDLFFSVASSSRTEWNHSSNSELSSIPFLYFQ